MFLKERNRSFTSLLLSSALLLLLAFNAAQPAFASGCNQDNAFCASTSTLNPHVTSTNGTVTFSPTSLNGLNETLSIAIPVDVSSDATSSWTVQIGMTPLTNADHTLPTTLHVAVMDVCNSGYPGGPSVCFPPGIWPSCLPALSSGASTSIVPSVSALTAAGSTPSPVTVINSPLSDLCGIGVMTFTTTLTATLLAKDTYAGTYSCLLELTVVSGPDCGAVGRQASC
jgi:hypothetical protein